MTALFSKCADLLSQADRGEWAVLPLIVGMWVVGTIGSAVL